MQWFTNRSLTAKLMLSFGLIALLIAVVSYIGIQGIETTNQSSADIHLAQYKPSLKIAALRGQTHRLRAYRARLLSETEPQAIEKGVRRIEQIRKEIADMADAYVPDIRDDEERKAFDAYRAAVQKYEDAYHAASSKYAETLNEKTRHLLQSRQKDLALKQLDDVSFADKSLFEDVIASLNAMLAARMAVADRKFEEAQEAYQTTFAWVTGTAIIGFVGALALGYLLSWLIGNPLRRMMLVLEAVAKGDFSQRVLITSRDELGRMAQALNTANESTGKARDEMARLSSMIEQSPNNIMFADREFKIRYANPATLKTLRPLEKLLPVKVDQLIGQSMDIFHKRPETQRKLLGDPSKLPHRTQFSFGPETLELIVSAVTDGNGKYLGAMVNWDVVTQRVNTEKAAHEASDREVQRAQELRRKVDQILGSVNGMAQGDFSVTIPDLGDDAVGQMAKALNQALESVRGTLQEVRNVAGIVESAAQELSSASEEIASGAQEQASSLEETAASLEQITATIKQNTDSAQQARQLAGNSKEVAEKGGQVVGNAVDAMAAINQSSKKIADIITAIDEIAFQTNLLALNAAVEAARAGEQGRGFAVVAAEVRNLAQRSATAAKEIKSLIQDSVRKVDNGTDLVNRSGQTLIEIVTSVKRVTDIVGEIAAASREQSTGVDQVNKAVAQMDKVTQTNAGQTEELSSTSQALLSHAEQLQSLVSHFKLGGEEAAPSPTARPRSRNVAPSKTKAPPRSKPREPVAAGARNGRGKVHDLDRLDHDLTNGDFKEF